MLYEVITLAGEAAILGEPRVHHARTHAARLDRRADDHVTGLDPDRRKADPHRAIAAERAALRARFRAERRLLLAA